jgi:hypothetical protein
MKKSFIRIVLAVVIAAMCLSAVPFAASAAPEASDYIDYYSASISKSSTTMTVNFSIYATGTMTSLGASTIRIYSKSGSASTLVSTLSSSTTTGMLKSNSAYHSSSVQCSGTAGTQYYAVVTFYAADSSGSETKSYTTGTVTL